MTVPASLAQWHERMDFLDPPLAEALSSLARGLSGWFGPFRAPLSAGSGEPDGYEGLDRRGRYDRLLLSEWAVASAAPLEFLRRATTGEHLFLQPAQRSETSDRTCRVLFDAGPDQMGAARLLHLVALTVLARRAEEAGATFRWGILQAPGTWHTDTGIEAWQKLLRARSWSPPTRELADAWALVGDEDVWVIGGARARVSPATHVHVRRDARRVHLDAPGHPPISFDLPSEEACNALLRGRFAPVVKPVATTRGIKRVRLALSSSERKLLVLAPNRLAAWAIGDGTRDPKLLHECFAADGEVYLGAGWSKAPLLLVDKGGRYQVQRVGRSFDVTDWGASVPRPSYGGPSFDRGKAGVRLETCKSARGGRRAVLFLDAKNALWCLDADTARLDKVLRDATCLRRWQSDIFVVDRTSDPKEGKFRRRLVRWQRDPEAPPSSVSGLDGFAQDSPQMDLGYGGSGALMYPSGAGAPTVAVQMSRSRWRICRPQQGQEVDVPVGTHAVGLFRTPKGFGLVLMDRERRTVSKLVDGDVETLAELEVAATSVSFAADQGRLFCLLEDAHVVAIDLQGAQRGLFRVDLR